MKKKTEGIIISSVLGIALAMGLCVIENDHNFVTLADISVMAHAEGEGGEITVDCSKNISGPGSYTFTECKPECPDKKGTMGPDDGTCTTYW